MPFEPGKSGNPSGRPRYVLPDGRTLSELCRTHTEDAVNALVSVCTGVDVPAAAKVAASQALLDRGWGKPAQAVEVTGADGGPLQHRDMSVAPLAVLEWLAAQDASDDSDKTVQ